MIRRKHSGGSTVLSIKLPSSSLFREDEWNVASGILPLLTADLSSGLFSSQLVVRNQGRKSFSEWMQQRRSTEDFLFILNCMLSTVIECQKWGLRAENISWAEEDMFISNDTDVVFMTYWPMESPLHLSDDILNFLVGIVDQMNSHNCDPFITDGLNTCIYQSNLQDFSGLRTACSKLQTALGYARAVTAADTAMQTMVLGGNTGCIWLDPLAGGKVITVCEMPAKIGRDPLQCSVVLATDCSASRMHAELSRYGGCYYLKDLNSTNGTYVDGSRLAPNVQIQLQNGACISFGDAEFSVSIT